MYKLFIITYFQYKSFLPCKINAWQILLVNKHQHELVSPSPSSTTSYIACNCTRARVHVIRTLFATRFQACYVTHMSAINFSPPVYYMRSTRHCLPRARTPPPPAHSVYLRFSILHVALLPPFTYSARTEK